MNASLDREAELLGVLRPHRSPYFGYISPSPSAGTAMQPKNDEVASSAAKHSPWLGGGPGGQLKGGSIRFIMRVLLRMAWLEGCMKRGFLGTSSLTDLESPPSLNSTATPFSASPPRPPCAAPAATGTNARMTAQEGPRQKRYSTQILPSAPAQPRPPKCDVACNPTSVDLPTACSQKGDSD